MGKRISARAVIVQNGKLLLMFRRRRNEDGGLKEFYVTPGGGVEEGETPEQTVVRELKEEMNVDINILEYLGAEEREPTIDHFYKAEIISGTPTLSGEELERMSLDNYYEPMFIDINTLDARENVYGLVHIKKAIGKAQEWEIK